ncbi:hypothetical protein AVEN_196889-1 [Araneus ventricosus]|uniref:RNase H type-1 domain-containing protein n=1 Tax=Araneus ventricosus TaxID=182803 RepID=A0A4Y2EFT7_ARAVE|nr:hypothetical protein AVEN_196889-1 [Araneus ventricosus]
MVTPVLTWHLETLHDSNCKNSSNETGVLVGITGHGPAPPEGITYYHLWTITQTQLLLISRETENPLTYPAASHSGTRGAPPTLHYNTPPASSCLEPSGSFPVWMDGARAVVMCSKIEAMKFLQCLDVWTDSESSLHSIASIGTKSPIAQQTQEILLKSPTIKLGWIRAHVGYSGNEAADVLAKKAQKKASPHTSQRQETLPRVCIRKIPSSADKKNGTMEKQAGVFQRFA